MTAKTLDDLFRDTLQDIYYAEQKILKGLEKMVEGATCTELQAAFKKHHAETEGQIMRLEKIFALIDEPAKGKKCDAIEGILDEANSIIKDFKGAPALDAGLVSSAQAVEHYEITRYGTLKSWAEMLGYGEAVTLLDQSLQEETATDQFLTELAERKCNPDAMRMAAE
jgi:ferritin-like metal-binding protein YciE